MADIQDIRAFVEQLRTAVDFQSGATILLDELLAAVDAGFSKVAFNNRKILRGMLHLRPDGTYRELTVRECVANSMPDNAVQPSSTAWRLVEQLRAPFAIDVLAARVNIIGSAALIDHSDATSNPFTFDGEQSIQMFGERDTTHLLILPLIAPRGSLDGMVSLEIRCQGAIGAEIPWADFLPDIESLMMVGTPYVLSLPPPIKQTTSALPVSSKWFSDHAGLLEIFASQKQTMLISGPTGSGKTYLARWIHENSAQRNGPFVEGPLNEVGDESGLPHLFGWVKGAFTGAIKNTVGWASQAEGGTLFLDEIDTLSRNQQQGLLRFFDTYRYTVMGGEEHALNNTRFIVASNSNLSELVEQGVFREDLYHRINSFCVEIPPLRERRDELAEWSQYLVDQIRSSWQIDRQISFTATALSLVSNYSWPGNLRELNATVIRACAYAQSDTDASDDMLVITDRHVEMALDRRRPNMPSDPVSLLHRAATALFDSAAHDSQRLYEPIVARKGLLFDMVWLVAVQEVGDPAFGHARETRETVATMLGKEKSLADGNYGRELKQAFRRIDEFYRAHEQAPPSELTRLLEPIMGRSEDSR